MVCDAAGIRQYCKNKSPPPPPPHHFTHTITTSSSRHFHPLSCNPSALCPPPLAPASIYGTGTAISHLHYRSHQSFQPDSTLVSFPHFLSAFYILLNSSASLRPSTTLHPPKQVERFYNRCDKAVTSDSASPPSLCSRSVCPVESASNPVHYAAAGGAAS